ncbi:hypothetical protein HDU87_002170 [Geranomyces variabilis]|uniref:Molybdenum cofactor sulfurase n=1 Tax=Geranomyces variabilis TaxID=109894 RepID=A0AAD5XS94_9FUNG|nr:hypothetical protein HDU87_002170 [Geranomyces variabilis]
MLSLLRSLLNPATYNDRSRPPLQSFSPPPPDLSSIALEFQEAVGTKRATARSSHLETLRQTEYPQLTDQVYLDYAGTTPYPASVVRAHTEDLLSGVLYGNPHSAGSPSSAATQERIDAVRGRVLRYLNADPEEYAVVFTSGATAAARIVGESIDWAGDNRKGEFWYLNESHTSVVGIRGLVEEGGKRSTDSPNIGQDVSRAKAVNADAIESLLAFGTDDPTPPHVEAPATTETIPMAGHFNLVAFPAQCNATGTRYPLRWIREFRRKNWGKVSALVNPAHQHPHRLQDNGLPFLVLLDAASYLSTATLDLSAHPADFTIMSFYKIFGFPTGIGALVLRRDVSRHMRKRYHGGGTVGAITVAEDERSWQVPKDNLSSRFEDGTLPFLEILALDRGFDYLEGLGGMRVVGGHATALREYVLKRMDEMKYADGGGPLCILYSAPDGAEKPQGPIINFNLRASSGYPISPTSVLRLAAVQHIHLRAGCFCNPGACQRNLGLLSSDVRRNFHTHGVVCGGNHDVIDNKPAGGLRISFGTASTLDDCSKWLEFLATYFLEAARERVATSGSEDGITEDTAVRVHRITVFPIKSCGGFSPSSWSVDANGFRFDREWMLVDATNAPLTLKRCRLMSQIRILELDVEKGILTVQAGKQPALQIPIDKRETSGIDAAEAPWCSVTPRASSPRYDNTYPAKVHAYFSAFLNVECRLVRVAAASETGFANQSPFLISSTTSFADLCARIPATLGDGGGGGDSTKPSATVDPDCLRANISVAGLAPYAEDALVGRTVLVNNAVCLRIDDLCSRCQIVNVDPTTARVSKQPFTAMAKYRNIAGKGVCFGVLAGLISGRGAVISIGDVVRVA